MEKLADDTDSVEVLFLPPPNMFGLPALDKGELANSQALEVAAAQWPQVETLVREARWPEAIAAMEALAKEMHERTRVDPEPWRKTLLLSRLVLYDNILTVGRWKGCMEDANQSLLRARQWDREAEEHIADLLRGDGNQH